MYIDGIILLIIYVMASAGLIIALYAYYEIKELKSTMSKRQQASKSTPQRYQTKIRDPWRK